MSTEQVDGNGNGRDAKGRFVKGNRGGPGNPFARQVAGFRKALIGAVSKEDMRTLAGVLRDKALGGDVAAIRLLLAYTVGKPVEPVDPDRLDIDEWDVFEKEAEMSKGVLNVLESDAPEMVLMMGREVKPVLSAGVPPELHPSRFDADGKWLGPPEVGTQEDGEVVVDAKPQAANGVAGPSTNGGLTGNGVAGPSLTLPARSINAGSSLTQRAGVVDACPSLTQRVSVVDACPSLTQRVSVVDACPSLTLPARQIDAGPSTNGGLTVANGIVRSTVVEDGEEYVPCGIGYGTAQLILREYREEERRKRNDKLGMAGLMGRGEEDGIQ